MHFELLKFQVHHKMEILLNRTYHPNGVNGVLTFKGEEICKTVELPWRDNRPRVSCIPEGKYKLRKRTSPKFKEHFEVMDVKDRRFILFHPGNDAGKELRGCIAPVMIHTGEGKGSFSKIALERMKDRLYPLMDNGHTVILNIKKTGS